MFDGGIIVSAVTHSQREALLVLLSNLSLITSSSSKEPCFVSPLTSSSSSSSSQSELSSLLPVLDRLLETGPDTPALLQAEAQLLQLVLGKYNEASAPLLAKEQNCLDLFIRALKTSTQQHAGIPSCQIIALEQVRRTNPSIGGRGLTLPECTLTVMLSIFYSVFTSNPD